MEHEVIISSKDFEEYKKLKQLKREGGLITTVFISSMGFTRVETIHTKNKKTQSYLYELLNRMTHNDELKHMSCREFRSLKKRL